MSQAISTEYPAPGLILELFRSHDYARGTDHRSGCLTTPSFSIAVFPDTALTLIGQSRQILWAGRIAAQVVQKPLKQPKTKWYDGYRPHDKRIDRYNYYIVGPDVQTGATYIRRCRRKNRPGYITDTMIDVVVTWRHGWRDAENNTWPLAHMIAAAMRADRAKRKAKRQPC